MKKLLLAIFWIILLVVGTYGQGAYTVDKTVNIGEGYEAKYITYEDNRKSILVKFPEHCLESNDKFSACLPYPVQKLVDEKEFCNKCEVKFTITSTELGTTLLYMKTLNWEVLVKPIIDTYENPKIVGIELVPKKLSVSL